MKSGPAIFKLMSSSSTGRIRKGVRDLDYYGIDVQTCRTVAELSRALRDLPEEAVHPVVIIDGHDDNALSTVAALRAVRPDQGLVALVRPDDEQTLIELLRVGVDMYCPDNASAELLLALMRRMLHRQVRRTETPTKAGLRARPQRARPSPIDRIPGQVWELSEQGWAMRTPGGQRIPLTTGERAFLTTLIASPESKAPHEVLIEAVNTAYNQTDGPTHQNRLGVMVSRMRKKFKDAGEPLPLRSIHNWGYMFVVQ